MTDIPTDRQAHTLVLTAALDSWPHNIKHSCHQKKDNIAKRIRRNHMFNLFTAQIKKNYGKEREETLEHQMEGDKHSWI